MNRQASQAIRELQDPLIRAVAAHAGLPSPEPEASPRTAGPLSTAEHLAYLAAAVAQDDPRLFDDYVRWLQAFLAAPGAGPAMVRATLEGLQRAIDQVLPAPLAAAVAPFISSGLALAGQAPPAFTGLLTGDTPLRRLAQDYLAALLDGERQYAEALVMSALDDGTCTLEDLYLEVFQRTQYEIGRLWQAGYVSIAQEHYGTAVTQAIISELYPRIFARERVGRRLVAACVGGETHELGARMVADFFEMAGWDTYYLGANMPPGSMARYVEQHPVDVVAISVTMAIHLDAMAAMIQSVRATPAGRRVKILCGGYPFIVSPDLWRHLGADGSAPDGRRAVQVAEALLRNESTE